MGAFFMRISPIFTKAAAVNSTFAKGFQRNNCRKPQLTGREMNQTDLFVRLAEASMKDVRIESELRSMGLI